MAQLAHTHTQPLVQLPVPFKNNECYSLRQTTCIDISRPKHTIIMSMSYVPNAPSNLRSRSWTVLNFGSERECFLFYLEYILSKRKCKISRWRFNKYKELKKARGLNKDFKRKTLIVWSSFVVRFSICIHVTWHQVT